MAPVYCLLQAESLRLRHGLRCQAREQSAAPMLSAHVAQTLPLLQKAALQVLSEMNIRAAKACESLRCQVACSHKPFEHTHTHTTHFGSAHADAKGRHRGPDNTKTRLRQLCIIAGSQVWKQQRLWGYFWLAFAQVHKGGSALASH